MIDTDKYEGYTEGPWWIEEVLDNGQKSTWLMGNFPQDNMLFYIEPTECNDTDVRLIADAPLLLAEVKRLRERIDEFGLAVTEAIGCMEGNGEIDERTFGWLYNHLSTLLWPTRYHVEGKRWNHDTCEWELIE